MDKIVLYILIITLLSHTNTIPIKLHFPSVGKRINIILSGNEDEINDTIINCKKEITLKESYSPISLKIEIEDKLNTQNTYVNKYVFGKRIEKVEKFVETNIDKLKNIGIVITVLFFSYASIIVGLKVIRGRKYEKRSSFDIERLQVGVQCDPETPTNEIIHTHSYYDMPMTAGTNEYAEIVEK